MLHCHGRRYEPLDTKADCKNKPRARQPISTVQEALEHAIDELDGDFGECPGPEEDPIPPPAEPQPLPPGWAVVSEDET